MARLANGMRLNPAATPGDEAFIIIAAAGVPSAELMGRIFPGRPQRKPRDREQSLLSHEKARLRLGYQPRHGWRDPQPAG